MSKLNTVNNSTEIAIVGMVCRFPGARNIDEFWQNLRDGRESVSFFSKQELQTAGIPMDVINDSHYVKARAVLEDAELFDAAFFGFTPRDAIATDPQHRIFLEGAWEALENAGYNPETYSGRIGIYAGTFMNKYMFSLYTNPQLLKSVGGLQARIGNDKDFLTTLVSYKLNLRGPSVNIQTACSTSLVAVHIASQSLLNGECDMALAGGVTINVPQREGYFYQVGGIDSPDGHCRAFDAKAQGTINGNGMGIVVLKRLEDALKDGDCIHAVIKGSAINNDGSSKVGYTAPSVSGQAEVISEALAMAGIQADTIGYVEAHGTGTYLGDPIEVEALSQAFYTSTEKKGFCAIGSVKTNIGHLDAAAGIASLIKTALALKYGLLPPSLHFEQPNPEIDFANSPFFVNTKLTSWKTGQHPRRAGISSFGIGGTNAHVIVEEAPYMESSDKGLPWHLLVLSAKTQAALMATTTNLVVYLKQHASIHMNDIAYTLQVGRQPFSHRRTLVCQDRNDAITSLEMLELGRVHTSVIHELKQRPVAFLFPGQGAQYVQMARELYQTEPIFHDWIDRCSELLQDHIEVDLRVVLYPGQDESQITEAIQQLSQTRITQPALFTIEYALAQLWMSWGIYPQAMIGHSIGEYVAACLAGVISLEDSLALVAIRGHLMQQLPHGSMLIIPLSEQEVQPLLNEHLSLAAVNGPMHCVISGSTDGVDALQEQMTEKNIECHRLHTSHAFHSFMMDPILEPFMARIKQLHLKPPTIPYLSNLSGTWITESEATNPDYWARHMRQTVHFARGMQELLKTPDVVLLEVGPGQTLCTLAKQQKPVGQVLLSSMRHPSDSRSDVAFLLNTLGQLWLAGIEVSWASLYERERRHRLPLPTYPFERQRYWLEPRSSFAAFSSTESIEHIQPHKLVSPTTALFESDDAYVPPRNEIEQSVMEVWLELFAIERVSIYDNFFDLGGNSLLAIQLSSQLREVFQMELPINKLFEMPTVARLAKLIEELRPAQEDLEAINQLLGEIESLSEEEVLFRINEGLYQRGEEGSYGEA